MHIAKAKKYGCGNWVIYATQFDETAFEKLLTLVEMLGLERDLEAEQFFLELCNSIAPDNKISGNFSAEGYALSFDYYPQEEIFIASWKSAVINGNELIALLAS